MAERRLFFLDELDLSAARQGAGETRRGLTTDGRPLRVAGRSFARGVGTHAPMELIVDLSAAVSGFRAWVGVAEEVGRAGSVIFELQADERTIYHSGIVRGREGARQLEVSLEGVRRLVMLVHDGGDGIEFDHVVWGDAAFLLGPDSGDPRAVPLQDQAMPDVAPFDPAELAIHHPRVVGGGVGRPFLFRIPATGPAGMRFSSAALPPGLTLDGETGILRGTLAEPGEFLFPISVRAGRNRVEAEFLLMAGPGRLARTPPMGWSSQPCWGTVIDAAGIGAAAMALDDSGLSRVGYRYVITADGWQGKRDRRGTLLPHAGFPSMDALTELIHELGLLAGICSSPGRRTTGGYPGSFGHVQEDARRFASWGFDYLKYDLGSYLREVRKPDRVAHMAPFEAMAAALGQVDRDLVFAISQGGMEDVWEWGAMVGANLWRTGEDPADTWGAMAGVGFRQGPAAPFAGPGRWNDPGRLMLGDVGLGGPPRPTRLTPVEQQTQMTLWAMLAAPLLIGCDPASLKDRRTLALLGNPEVLAVNQDAAGRQGVPVFRDGQQEAWSRLLADGSLAVALFNRAPLRSDVAVLFEEAGARGVRRCSIRDLWRRRDLGTFSDGYSASLPPHGSMLLRMRPV